VSPLDELERLLALFPGGRGLVTAAEHIPAALTPEPFRTLLVHQHHMTVTMEAFHQARMEVRVIDRSRDENVYSRKILLVHQRSGQVVQFGIVRFDLGCVTQAVRDEILAERQPLGRILINYNVLRHIDLGAILRLTCGQELADSFGCPRGQITYGRLATIFCNQKPAVDLLEVPSPVGIDPAGAPAAQPSLPGRVDNPGSTS